MERVGALLGNLEGHATLRRRLAEARAVERWREIVGPQLAEITRPLRVAGERLIVEARGSALRQELVFHKSAILSRFNQAAGMMAARGIVFVEAGSGEPVEMKGAGGPKRAPEPVEEKETGVRSEETAKEVVYKRFDAAAYRREMDSIASGSDPVDAGIATDADHATER